MPWLAAVATILATSGGASMTGGVLSSMASSPISSKKAWRDPPGVWPTSSLPLALELAAARSRSLDPEALLSRLDLALSKGWARDLPERQRTMRATLDWSHELLSEPEKVLFRKLSVFAGGFTLEAVDALGEGDAPVLGNLVEQSMIVAESALARYGMLEPVRQYALEKVPNSRMPT